MTSLTMTQADVKVGKKSQKEYVDAFGTVGKGKFPGYMTIFDPGTIAEIKKAGPATKDKPITVEIPSSGFASIEPEQYKDKKTGEMKTGSRVFVREKGATATFERIELTGLKAYETKSPDAAGKFWVQATGKYKDKAITVRAFGQFADTLAPKAGEISAQAPIAIKGEGFFKDEEFEKEGRNIEFHYLHLTNGSIIEPALQASAAPADEPERETAPAAGM